MRFSVFIFALLATICQLDAAVRFTRAEWFPDLGISMPRLENAVAAPMDLPRAEAYLVAQKGESRLEDRFNVFDLWEALSIRGRWRDAAGNTLMIARLVAELPEVQPEFTQTRMAFSKSLKPLPVKDSAARDRAVYALAPVEEVPPERSRRDGRRNFLDIVRYVSTNETTLVYAFRPRSPETREVPDWYLVCLVGAADEDADELEESFSSAFLDEIGVLAARSRPSAPDGLAGGEREFDHLREAYRRSVANYDDWHFLAAENLLITDNLDDASRGAFIGTLTNELPRLRHEYAATVPSHAGEGFYPAAIRVFATREEYLAYVGAEARWTAAVWSPLHRELVLHLPPNGVETLLRTVWHEAFHQYLAYAGCMLSSAPWINEGHAELFEHAHFDAEGTLQLELPYEYAALFQAEADRLSDLLPAVIAMDYDEFYAGTAADREVKYKLAWSIAYFLEKGAPKVRFRPYEDLRAEYMDALVRTQSGRRATLAVFSGEKMKRFVADWRDFWRKN